MSSDETTSQHRLSLLYDIETLYIIDDDRFISVKSMTLNNIDKRLNKTPTKSHDDLSPSRHVINHISYPGFFLNEEFKERSTHKHAHRKGLKECKICQNLIHDGHQVPGKDYDHSKIEKSLNGIVKKGKEIEAYSQKEITIMEFFGGPPPFDQISNVSKYNREVLKTGLQIIGCKPLHAHLISENVFDKINDILEEFHNKNETATNLVSTAEGHKIVSLKSSLFSFLLREQMKLMNYGKPEYLRDFEVVSKLVERKTSVMILLGGTSGTGKSTLASLLASRLGISTVLSTDTIRHVMRNFISKEQEPILFASTYECGEFVDKEIQSEKKRTILGFKKQCELVMPNLINVLQGFSDRHESIVVEGVHLNVKIIQKLAKKFPQVIPFQICIKSESKHKERFAVRSKHMTLDPKFNKYIKFFKNIRNIAKFMVKKAEACLIPRIDNSNVDKSIGTIHSTVVRSLRKVDDGEKVFEQNKFVTLHQEYNVVTRNQMSSRQAQQMIQSKVNKNEIVEQFFLMNNESEDMQIRINKFRRGQSVGVIKILKEQLKKQKKHTTAELMITGLDGERKDEEEEQRDREFKKHKQYNPDDDIAGLGSEETAMNNYNEKQVDKQRSPQKQRQRSLSPVKEEKKKNSDNKQKKREMSHEEIKVPLLEKENSGSLQRPIKLRHLYQTHLKTKSGHISSRFKKKVYHKEGESDDDISAYSGGSAAFVPSIASASVDFFGIAKTETMDGSQKDEPEKSESNDSDVNSMMGEKSDKTITEEDENDCGDDDSAHSSMNGNMNGIHSDDDQVEEKSIGPIK